MTAAPAPTQLAGIVAGDVQAQSLHVRGDGTAVQVMDSLGAARAEVDHDGNVRCHALVVDRVVLAGPGGHQLQLTLDAAGSLLVARDSGGPVLAVLSLPGPNNV